MKLIYAFLKHLKAKDNLKDFKREVMMFYILEHLERQAGELELIVN